MKQEVISENASILLRLFLLLFYIVRMWPVHLKYSEHNCN